MGGMTPNKIQIALIEDNVRFRTNLNIYFELIGEFNVVFVADSVEAGLIQLELHLTSYEEEEKILKALCSGATSYISKRSSLEDISSALQVVHSGGSFMSPSIAREIVTYFSKGQVKEKEEILTPRQTEIMELMIHGNTYSSIAKNLAVSTETIKSHIKKIYVNLHVNNKAQAIAKYMSN